MTNDEAQWVLAELYRRWPHQGPFPDPTVALWLDELLPPLNIDHAAAALSLLVDSEELRPTWAKFRASVIEEGRLARLDARAAAAPLAPGGERAGQFLLPVASDRDRAWTDAVKAALAAKVRHGVECSAESRARCLPGCPWGDFIVDRVAAAQIPYVPERATIRCGRCMDTGALLTDNVGRRTSHPCPGCNEVAFELWSAGHFEPNHTCSTCRPGRARAKVDA